jgi:hypothetical protein
MAVTTNLALPLIDGSMTADVPRDHNALANALDTAIPAEIADLAGVGRTVETVKANADAITAHVADYANLITDLKLTNNTDCTATIQAGLDKKGWVRISSKTPATYLISDTLQIDSDTVLELSDNVTIKLANGTSKYMLVNKDQINGNTNITLRGGTWDGNVSANPATGGYPLMFPGHILFLHKIDNLKYENFNLKNCAKFCSLVADCENFIANNIGFDNGSDGMHFHPPLKNAYFENIHGHTGDDMLAFTLGDYATYQVSNVGDFESVTIRHVVCDAVDNVVSLLGSGAGSAYRFKNFIIDDISGSVVNSTIRCVQDGTDLINTYVDGITMKNICTTGGASASIVFTPTYASDVLMENITCTPTNSSIIIGVNGASYDNITIKNVKVKNDVTGVVFTIYGGTTINNLTIDKAKAKLSSAGVFIKFRTPATVKKLTVNNIDVEGSLTGSSTIFELDGATINDFSINNMYVNNVIYFMYVKANLTVKISNSQLAGTIQIPIIVFPSYTLRIIGSGNQMAAMTPTLSDATAHCSINDLSWKTEYSKMTSQLSDMFYNTQNASGNTPPFLVGNVIWNGTNFKNLF